MDLNTLIASLEILVFVGNPGIGIWDANGCGGLLDNVPFWLSISVEFEGIPNISGTLTGVVGKILDVGVEITDVVVEGPVVVVGPVVAEAVVVFAGGFNWDVPKAIIRVNALAKFSESALESVANISTAAFIDGSPINAISEGNFFLFIAANSLKKTLSNEFGVASRLPGANTSEEWTLATLCAPPIKIRWINVLKTNLLMQQVH